MHEITLVNRAILLYVFTFSFTEIILEEATQHVSILISNLSVPIWDDSICIDYEVRTKVVDELVAFLMLRGAESFLPVLVAAKEMALVGTL